MPMRFLWIFLKMAKTELGISLFNKHIRMSRFSEGMSEIANRNDLKVKISGCFNSCGQHHIADIGFLGSVQRKGSFTAPVFQVVLGGTTEGNASSYGLVTGKVPARYAPDVLERLTAVYSAEKLEDESFSAFVKRLGKVRMKSEIQDFQLLFNHNEKITLAHHFLRRLVKKGGTCAN